MKPASLLKDDKGEELTAVDTLKALMDSHCPGSEDTEKIVRTGPGTSKPIEEIKKGAEFVTEKIVKKAIKEFSNGKAPGLDNITPSIMKVLPGNTIKRLTTIMKACISLGHTPKLWREGKISFLVKPGKKDLSEPRAYRPITLASFLQKTLERIVVWELETSVLKENPLHENQHAFTIGRSCDSALSQTVDLIEKGLNRGEYVIGIFLDIRGAFDNVNPEEATKALKERRFPEWFTTWYGHYIKNRQVRANFCDEVGSN